MDSESSSLSRSMVVVPSTTLVLNALKMHSPDWSAVNKKVMLDIASKFVSGFPSLAKDNAKFMSPRFELTPVVGFEMFGEAFMLWKSKK